MIHSVSGLAPAVSKPLAIAVAVCAAFSAPVFAQTAQDRNLETVVVTATRTPQIAKEVLADNTTISAEEIARSGQTSLVELLQRKRGIEITRNGGPGANSSVFIRGADNKQSIVLVDGVRVGSSTSGGATWAAIPLSQVDHIEIVYGPLSSLYGADAVGGVVQIFTKKGEGSATPSVSAGVGSYATRSFEAGVSGSSGAFHYALRAAHEKSDGFSATKPGALSYNPDKDGYKNDGASGQFSFDLAKGQEVGITFLNSHLDSHFDSSNSFDNHTLQRLETIAAYSRNRLTPSWTSEIQIGQSKDLSDSYASTGKDSFNTTQTDVTWQNNFKINTSDLLQVLLEQRKEKVDSRITGVNGSPTTVNGSRTTNSIALAYQLKRDQHLASVNVRHDDNNQFGSYSTGNMAYGYRITDKLRVNASYGTSFRAPTFNDLYYPNFGSKDNKPERGHNTEAGLYYENGTSELSAVMYRNHITDLIVTAVPCPDKSMPNSRGCAYNVDKALLTGISLGGKTTYHAFTLHASLDLQDPRNEKTDLNLQRRAKRHGTIGVDYATGLVRVGGEVLFSGTRFDDLANRNKLGGYGVVNLYASYDVAPKWTVFGRWDNVFDKNYELARTYNTPGSSFFAGVRYGM